MESSIEPNHAHLQADLSLMSLFENLARSANVPSARPGRYLGLKDARYSEWNDKAGQT